MQYHGATQLTGQPTNSVFTLKPSGTNVAGFYGSHELSDCSVVTEDGNTIPCHKLTLSAASPVFKAMFVSSDAMSEGITSRVEIKGSEPSVAVLLLLHIYGHEILVRAQRVMDLYKLADQYQVKATKDEIEKAIDSARLQLETIKQLMLPAASLQHAAEGVRASLALKASAYAADIIKQPDMLKAWGAAEIAIIMQQHHVHTLQRLKLALAWMCVQQRCEDSSVLWQHVSLRLLKFTELKQLQQEPGISHFPELNKALFRECIRRMERGKEQCERWSGLTGEKTLLLAKLYEG